MRDNQVIQVFCQWETDQGFIIWGLNEESRPIDAFHVKLKLFAWHEESYYGTFLEEVSHKGKLALLLPAHQALRFFLNLPQSEYVEFRWSEEILQLQLAAPAIQNAITKGQWQPDYGKWLKGKWGWQFNLSDDIKAIDIPFLDSWLEAILADLIENDPKIKLGWQSLLAKYPLLKPRDLTYDNILPEDEWLTAIGWQKDDTPFKICLQLVEPDDGETWSLVILLQDKANEEIFKEYPLIRFHDKLSKQSNLHILPTSWLPFLEKINTFINRCLQLIPWLSTAEGQLKTTLNEEQAWDFLTNGSISLVNAGYTVLLPSWWDQLRKNKPKLKVQTKSLVKASGQAMFGLQDLVQFNWKLAIGNLEITEEEFKGLVREKRRLIKFRGQWIQLDPQVLAQIMTTIKHQNKGLTLSEVLQLHLMERELDHEDAYEGAYDVELARETNGIESGVRVEIALNTSLAQMVKQLTNATPLVVEDQPKGFRGHLRPYQLVGYSWMLFLRKFGLGGCLADDMGLGKTIQFISYLLEIKEKRSEDNPSLLICPTSVIGNWQMEIQRFAPGLEVYVHYGPQRNHGDIFKEGILGKDLVITSYTLASNDEALIKAQDWDCICLDEAQNIKNAYTKQARAIRTFKSKHRLALTGTPMENRLSEIWSIMDFTNPGYLGSYHSFSRKFVKAIDKHHDPARIEQVKRLVKPFILRRLKTDPKIDIDLPEKQEYKEYLPLTTEQASLYENTLDEMAEKLDNTIGMSRRGVILSTLTKLKQICDHPALILKEGNSSPLRKRSTKVERLLDMVQELRAEGDKCLIFTQFVEMGHLLQRVLQKELGEKVIFLHGGVPKNQRDLMIKEFQAQDEIGNNESNIFILSLKAGGTGLNLTAANHVFHMDRWWNPAVENQATDRAYRIGQTKKVQVHKFITLGTLESRIDEMLNIKQNLNELIVGNGESWINELSNSEIRELFALRKDWIVSE